MRLFVLLFLFFGHLESHIYHVNASNDLMVNNTHLVDLKVKMDLSRVLRKVNDHYLSVAIDASLATEEKFMYLLGSQKLRTLAMALTPAFLRFGGTRQDFMVFNPQKEFTQSHNQQMSVSGDACERVQLLSLLEERLKKKWTQMQIFLQREDLQRKYRRVKFTENTVDMLYSFANCSGMDLIFGLNALLRTADNTWNSSNARSLMQYCESKQYMMSWELGNEPNSFEKKAGIQIGADQLGKDFVHLREIIRESKFFYNSLLYGPDISQPRGHQRYLLEGFLKNGAEAIDACTWHHYYVNGRDTSLEDFLDHEVLDSLALKTNKVLEIVKLVSPGTKVWLGETSSAYGGGALGLSDTFVAGFMWLDKLGLGARLGLDVVIRQVFVGSGSYHLVDDNMDPLPDYWLSVLYKKLVGQEVLRIEATSLFGRSKSVRMYLHCTNKKRTSYRNGALTLMAMNLSSKPAKIMLPDHISITTVEAFVLQSDQPSRDGLRSRSVRLNGEVLQMVDDKTLPELKGSHFLPGENLLLPGFSLAFYILTEAQAPACL